MKCNPFDHMLLALALGVVSFARADDPIITLQPINQTVIVGNRVSLAVAATTTNGPLTFQWQRGDDATPVAFTNLANATAAEFGYRSVSVEHTGDYRAIVANAGGNSVTSQVARIEVRRPPFTKITEGPLATDLGVMPVCPAWGDLNNDGYLDLMIVDDGRWAATNDFTRAVQMVYLNNADGTFRRATEADIGPLATRAVALLGPMRLADYDNDGYLDIYMYEGLNSEQEEVAYLYRGGPDGKLTLVGEDVGINRPLGPWLPGGYYPIPWGVSWVDYDQDGHLDIYLTTAFAANNTVDQLWRNQGNGTFGRVLADVFNRVYDGNFGCWADYDNDGDPDVLVGGTAGTGRFYRNDGGGQFSDITRTLGLSFGVYGAWGDYDNDGRLDLFAVTGLFWNDGAGGFMRKTGAGYPAGGGGANNWFDFDNDGYLDFFNMAYPGNRRCMMRNNRDGTFTEVNLGDLTHDPAGWLAGCADYDNDGFIDIMVPSAGNGPNGLYHNDGNANHWMLVKLVGTVSNRSGIGAKVRAQTTMWGQDVRQMREISGTPYTGDPRAHFGLGDATTVDNLRIEWPSGIVQELKDVAPNQILTVTEPPRLIPQGVGEFQIQCWINQSFEVRSSGDLVTWTLLATVTNMTGTLVFEDADVEAHQHACQYYRVVHARPNMVSPSAIPKLLKTGEP